MKKGHQEKLKESIGLYDRIFYFDSFMTMDVPRIKEEMHELYRLLGPNRSKVIFIAGGSHPTAAPEHTLSLGFDIAARGEGEVISGGGDGK